ncbi:MAG: hypothetical protein IKZ52_01595 [Bacteroidales bacterium]|nr:hypothetical protein [Bacteroidales bacterium]
MANWCFNEYAVKAATKNVLNFVNRGLENLGLEPKDNIKDAIESLWNDDNKVLMSSFIVSETFKKLGSDVGNEEGRPALESNEKVGLSSYLIDDATGNTTIYMWGHTPWRFPYHWLAYVKNTYDLKVYLCSHEEADAFNVYGEIDSLDFEFAEKYFLENGPDWDDYGDERVVEYYEAYFKCSSDLKEELLARFKDCVEGRM